MDKNRVSRGTHASVLSTANRQLFRVRILFPLLLLTLSLAGLKSPASGRTSHTTLRVGNAVTRFQSAPPAQGADRILLKETLITKDYQAKVAGRNCPACQQALVMCLQNGGADCMGQYESCLAGC